MSKMTETLNQAAQWYNERVVRERVLVLATACVLVFAAGWELLVAPLEARHQQLDSQLESAGRERDSLIEQQQTLTAQLENDPSAELHQRLESRQRRLERLDREITETTGQLIVPRDMVVLLRDMLSAQQGLELESLEVRAPVPIYDQGNADSEANEGREPLLYAHDVDLTIAGGYLDIKAYLERLEALDERLGWLQLDYRMGTWPQGEAHLKVRTLSLEAAWLGV